MRKTAFFRGCNLSYELVGDGPPVVFIQGVGAHGQAWRPQIEQLQQQFTCLALDNRGIGASQPAGKLPLTVQQMAEDVLSLMDAEGWPQAHIVGHSLGGLVAQCVGLIAPQRVLSLALLNTFANGRRVAPLTPRMFWWGFWSALGPPAVRRYAFLQLVWPAPALAQCDWRQLANQMQELIGHDLAERLPIVPKQLLAMRQTDLTNRLSQLAGIRTLVLIGAHDMLATRALGRNLAQSIPGAVCHELADASHAAPIQFPSRVNRLLSEHLMVC